MITRRLFRWSLDLQLWTRIGTMNLAFVRCHGFSRPTCPLPAKAGTPNWRFMESLHHQHNHAPAIIKCPNSDLVVSWYRGSGERKADDVAVYGARRPRKGTKWSQS